MASRQVSGLTTRTLALTDVFATQDAAGAAEAGKNTITELKATLLLNNVDNTSDSNKPISTAQAAVNLLKVQYKTYVAIISQTSTGAPTVNTLVKTDFSTTVVFTRTSAGIYVATITSSELVSGKTVAFFTHSTNGTGIIGGVWVDANNYQFTTRNFSGTLTDGILTASVIKIEVYP